MALLPTAAQAQVAEATTGTGLQDTTDAGSGEDSIVITGSRIQRRDLTSSSPIAVVSAEEFQLTGAINVEQVINTLPQAVPGTTGFSNNPGSGAATLNLRNLGATRTLVLVNGRRRMSYDTNQVVDLNTIPQFMLQNVEVLTGGQSATYGSDAIADVVNFNLRQDLEGAIIGGQYALTEQGNGARYDVNFAIGSKFADNKGSVTVYANYTRRESIFQDARDFSRNAAGTAASCVVRQIRRPASAPTSAARWQPASPAVARSASYPRVRHRPRSRRCPVSRPAVRLSAMSSTLRVVARARSTIRPISTISHPTTI